jgi:hypothetical protein
MQGREIVVCTEASRVVFVIGTVSFVFVDCPDSEQE